MGGKVSAEYYRKYRATHPDYRKREAERSRRRRAEKGRGDRTEEYRRRAEKLRHRRLRESADYGCLAESSLLRKARALAASVLSPDRRTSLWDDRYDELVGEAVVALCEGTDPAEAMRSWLKREWPHRFWIRGDIADYEETLRDPSPLP